MTPAQRPDLDLLADLDAGLLDEDTAASVRAAAEADPAARAVLDALAATRADLAGLPDPPVPPAVAARWSEALSAAAQPDAVQPAAASSDKPRPATATAVPAAPDAPSTPTPAPPRLPLRADRARGSTPPGGRPPRDARRSLWRRPAVLAAAALLVVLALAAVLGRGRTAVAVDGTDLVQQSLQSRGLHDTGAFEDPGRRVACLTAVRPPGVTPAAPLLGGRQVTFEGRDGVLLLLGTGRVGAFDVVVVDPGCSTLLAARRIGG